MMIVDGQAYLFLLPFMIFLSAALLSVIHCDVRIDSNESTKIIEAIEGESIVLRCELTKVKGYTKVVWSHNDILIVAANESNQNQQRQQRIHQIGGNLHINKSNKRDNGYYNCIANSDDNAASESMRRRISNTIKLEIVWLESAQITYRSTPLQKTKSHGITTSIVLVCKIIGNRLHEIRWYKNHQQIQSSASIDIDFDRHRLTLKNPTAHDDGIYYCLARNKVGSVQSALYRIEITADATAPHRYYRHRGGLLRCAHKNHRKLPTDHNGILQESDSNYNQKGTTLLCRGKRSNTMLHTKRSASDSADTEDDQLPEALQKPIRKRLSVDENRMGVLNCDFKHLDRKTGPLTVKWRKDGKLFRQTNLNGATNELSNDPNAMENPLLREDGRISVNTKNGSLIIMTTVPSDVGSYECAVLRSTDTPVTMQITELTIIEQLKFSPQPTSKGLELGSVGKVHCKVQGTPAPHIRWIKDSFEELPEMIDDINGTLVFKNVSESDRGNYTCIASNSQGQISATVVISPVVAPKFVVKPQGPIQVNEMASVMIHCTAIGDPKPKIQWDKDFDYLNVSNSESSRLHILENGTLHFTEVHLEDEGLYGCTIGSSAGLKREEAHLIVRPTEEFPADEMQEDSFFIARAVLITITVVFSYIILVVGLMFWCRIKRKARKNRMQLIAKENMDTFTGNDTRPNDESEPCLPEKNHRKSSPRNTNGTAGGGGTGNEAMPNNAKDSAQKSDDTVASNNSKTSKKSNLDHITVPRTILFDITQLGRGEMGTVSVAKVKTSDLKQYLHKDTVSTLTVTTEYEKRKSKTSLDDINEIKEDTENADDTKYALIKALNKVKDENVCIEFRRQIEMFRAISHRNVVKLFGLCRDKDPHYLLLEHTDLGDLKQFLCAHGNNVNELSTGKNGVIHKNNLSNGKSTTAIPPIKLPQLLLFAQHIARGMDAIYRARYIHRDLAARNCVIGSDLTVKISYPAIIKDKYASEYAKVKNVMVPLRWMAPECIEEDDCTIKSDVYSFGVLVWEIFTFCRQLPFENLSDEEYLALLQSNKVEWTTVPADVPDDMRSYLLSCWKSNPKERPSFSNLNSTISKCLQKYHLTS